MTEIVKPRLLWVGDCLVNTGFARVTENVLRHLGEVFELYVIGINYRGNPYDHGMYPYPVWPAENGGDIWGLGLFPSVCQAILPDLVVVNNDPWIVSRFASEFDRGRTPMAAYLPIDARAQSPQVCHQLSKLDLALFYTSFGEMECRRAGFTGWSEIIPHGVNTDLYRPLNRDYCRARLDVSQPLPPDAFIFGNVNRNSPRKRQDLCIEYFAEWVHNFHIPPNVYLHLHCAQHDSAGIDPAQLAYYYGVDKRIIMPPQERFTAAQGFPEADMPLVYNMADVQITATAGEGHGLTTHESMACGIPQILPQNSALAEWASGAAYFVPCSQHVAHPIVNTIGAIPDKVPFIQALDRMYRDASLRSRYGALALQRAREPRFQWSAVADEFKKHLGKMLIDKREAVAKRDAEVQNAEIQTQN